MVAPARLGRLQPVPATASDVDERLAELEQRLAAMQAEALGVVRVAGELTQAVRQERRQLQKTGELPDRLSVKDVAQRLSMSKGSVYTLLDSGRLRSVAVRGRRLIPAEAYRAFLAETEAR